MSEPARKPERPSPWSRFRLAGATTHKELEGGAGTALLFVATGALIGLATGLLASYYAAAWRDASYLAKLYAFQEPRYWELTPVQSLILQWGTGGTLAGAALALALWLLLPRIGFR